MIGKSLVLITKILVLISKKWFKSACCAQVVKLSIIPRSGGALGFTYTPPKTEDRALMFDNEIRGQLALLMGGRAAEELTCSHLSTGRHLCM